MFATYVYASVSKALRKFTLFIEYYQLQLINCGKFLPQVNFFLAELLARQNPLGSNQH
jgi:hypothetical protein